MGNSDKELHAGISENDRKIVEKINEKLATFSELEQQVIILKFGLQSGIPKDYDEVAKQLGLSIDQVKKIETQALRNFYK